MKIRNNSNNTWEKYNCGFGVVITIKPEQVFEVSDKAGKMLLTNLGHKNWLEHVDDSTSITVEKKEEPKAKEVEAKKVEKTKKKTKK